MDSVVHFEIPADDLERAKKFYTEVFGWKMQDMPEMKYVAITTAETSERGLPRKPGAINGGMMKKDGTAPSPVVVVNVESAAASIEKIEGAGGELIMPAMKVGDMGLYARVKDTEGNIIGVWENSPKA